MKEGWRYFGVVFSILLSACFEEASSGSSATSSDPQSPVGMQCSQATKSTSGTSSIPNVNDPYQYLNDLRSKSDLISFSKNTFLEQAAQNHAQYLNTNNASGHDESSGNSGFTGATSNERVAATGYKAAVSENVSTHSQGSFLESIDGLMSAIYHRFGFLSIDHNEVGIGSDQSNSNNNAAYVYNMGNSAINTLCSGSSFNGFGSSIYNVCSDGAFKIELSQYNKALSSVGSQNPDIIKWPGDNAIDVPPVFFEEEPDPLAAYSVSGYPVSVEFNQYKFASAPQLTSFTLKNLTDCSSVNLIQMSDSKYYMDKSNDPQSKFTEYQYAIFPQKRLEWATEYQVDIAYNDGTAKTLSWKFTTRDLGYKVYTVTTTGTIINSVTSGETFILYLPPANGNDDNSAYSASRPGTMQMDISFVDGNTLKVTVTGSGTAKITFHNLETTIQL